eukprot:3598938-Rhodomonas_salina.1
MGVEGPRGATGAQGFPGPKGPRGLPGTKPLSNARHWLAKGLRNSQYWHPTGLRNAKRRTAMGEYPCYGVSAVVRKRVVLCSYACAMRCTVLTCHVVLRAWNAMLGTARAYGGKNAM